MYQIRAGSENPPSPGCPALLLRTGGRCGVLTQSPCKSLGTSLCLHGFLSSTQGSLTLDALLHVINAQKFYTHQAASLQEQKEVQGTIKTYPKENSSKII